MPNQIILGVYRRLDNQIQNLPNDSPLAKELHDRRRHALHAVLDSQPGISVLDWGQTDDTSPHEFVQLSIAALAPAVLHYLVVPGIEFVAKTLAKKAVDEGSSELVKWLIAKLRPKQESKQVLDIQILLPNGTRINVDPPDGSATITITDSSGAVTSVNYKPADGTAHT